MSLAPSAVINRLRVVASKDYALAAWVMSAAGDIGAVVSATRAKLDTRRLALPDEAGICSPIAPLFDSEGRGYRVEYRILITDTDGSGPVITSNYPGSFRVNRQYPAAFQARDLSAPGESAKITKIANALDPVRLIWPHSDPTLGPPVVWPDGEGRYAVLGGNGRTIALLMAPDDRYADYLSVLRRAWPALDVPTLTPGKRAILVRVVGAKGGGALSQGDAIRLAGASQESTAAQEGPLGKALSVVRSLGVTDPGDLPTFQWDRAVKADPTVIREFQERNPGFWRDLMDRVGVGRRDSFNDPHRAAELIKSICAGFLPENVRRLGFGDQKTEEAVLGAMPMIVSLAGLIRAGDVGPDWNLLPAMSDAVAVYEIVRKRRVPIAKIPELLEQEAAQMSLAGAETTLSQVSVLGFILGAALARAAGTKDPETTIAEILEPYYAKATSAIAAPGAMSMFGPPVDPVAELAAAARVRLPRQFPPGARRLPARANSRRRSRRRNGIPKEPKGWKWSAYVPPNTQAGGALLTRSRDGLRIEVMATRKTVGYPEEIREYAVTFRGRRAPKYGTVAVGFDSAIDFALDMADWEGA
ncbi:MAG: hypothetical protein KGS10_04145 [Chloroflexi bacterium]|nr:hypothetical protein [Chloroflexota bacterium]